MAKTAQCQFPARFLFLKTVLELPEVNLGDCREFNEWKAPFNAKSIWLVFASPYLSNPASAMGHTFLRFEDPARSELLDFTAGYAAQVPENGGSLAYIYKGLFGGFKGEFSLSPYYGQFHQYLDEESRDLWEYRLNFSSPEIDFFLAHLWEISRQAERDYYFIDENCSYLLLEMLNAVRPQADMTRDFGPYVLPIETIKRIRDAGWISEVHRRPSLRSRLQERYYNLNPVQRRVFSSVHRKQMAVSQVRDTSVLEALMEYYHFTKISQSGKLEAGDEKIYREVLLNRAGLGHHSEVALQGENRVPSPDLSHEPHWVSLAAGVAGPGAFIEGEFSPALHDIMSRDEGFIRYSGVSFLDSKIRYYSAPGSHSSFQLDSLKIVEIANLVPYETFDHQFSWRLNAEISSRKELNCIDCYKVSLAPAAGIGLNLFGKKGFTYALLELPVESGRHLDPLMRLQVGPEVGGFWVPRSGMKFNLFARHLVTALPLGAPLSESFAGVRFFYAASPSLDVGLTALTATTQWQWRAPWSEGSLILRHYF